jgi:YgiT-type zinc finger domain-containing protein
MVHHEDYHETLSFNGETATLTGLAGWFCPACGEGELDLDSSKRYAMAHDDLIHRSRIKQREDSERRRYSLEELLAGVTKQDMQVLAEDTAWAREGAPAGRELI